MITALLLAAQTAAATPAKSAAAVPAGAVPPIILVIGWTLAVYTRRWIRTAYAASAGIRSSRTS